MKQAQVMIDDINRMKQAISKTNSYKLRNDYRKAIKRKTKELIEYCQYKGLKFDSANCCIKESEVK